MGAERLQLHTAHRLFAAVVLLSVVALALVDIREQSRQQPAEAAGLPPPYLVVLCHQHLRAIRTVQQVYQALAGLGGHLGQRRDGPPGWQALWRGLCRLRYLVEGMELAARLPPDA